MTRLTALLAGVLLAAAATAQDSGPPLPPPRPAAPEVAVPAPERVPDAVTEAVPLPPPRPDGPAAAVAEPPGTEAQACRVELEALGARFEARAPLSEGACGAPEPLRLSGLPEGIAVEPPATVTCPVAAALARWARDVVAPEARRHLGEAPTRLAIGTSYECRNQRSGAKLSEHAFANGVDVMGFGFGRRAAVPIAPRQPGTPEGAFQDAAQKGACAHFTTVLGPGSDAAHADHLHLDLRGRKGAYRICQ